MSMNSPTGIPFSICTFLKTSSASGGFGATDCALAASASPASRTAAETHLGQGRVTNGVSCLMGEPIMDSLLVLHTRDPTGEIPYVSVVLLDFVHRHAPVFRDSGPTGARGEVRVCGQAEGVGIALPRLGINPSVGQGHVEFENVVSRAAPALFQTRFIADRISKVVDLLTIVQTYCRHHQRIPLPLPV